MSSTDRKKDHIELTEKSRTSGQLRDTRFYYEPLLACHPEENTTPNTYFAGKRLEAPIWISSMTGGTGAAKKINRNLARVCAEYKLGMGLGSCRKLLDSDEYLEDFDVRAFIEDQPLFANLGIAQVVELIQSGKTNKIQTLVDKLQADGLIIHVNPCQEWLQPEGDRIFGLTPYRAVEQLISQLDMKFIVKEVGQGMGPESLKAILSLPINALEFAAFGGTNFAKMESLRDPNTQELDPMHLVGHTADEMISFIQNLDEEEVLCKEFIISGGIKNYLDGFYFNEKMKYNSVYGQAAAFLKHAKDDYSVLSDHVSKQIEGYKFALKYLKVRK